MVSSNIPQVKLGIIAVAVTVSLSRFLLSAVKTS